MKTINVGFCQYILMGLKPIAYTENKPVYYTGYDDILITIGENPSYSFVEEYEIKALKIYFNKKLKYGEKLKEIASLRKQFLEEVIASPLN